MDKLKDLSSLPGKPDQTFSDNDSNIDDATKKSSSKYEALTDELQTKTDDFIKAICATKTIATKAGKIQVKPLSNDAYETIDTFIGSIDDIIKWHEDEINRYGSYIHVYSNGVAECTKQNEELLQNIAEQKETINRLIESSTTMAKDFDQKVKVMEEKLKQMKAVEDEIKAKCALMEQKELEIKKQIGQIEGKADTIDYTLDSMKSILGQKDENIAFWKQKFEESDRLSHTQSAELNRKISELEVQLQASAQTREIETPEQILSDLEKQLSDTTTEYDEKIKALENEIAALKKQNEDLPQNDNAAPGSNNFVELKDVIIFESEIDYKKLNGKILVMNEARHFKDGQCYVYLGHFCDSYIKYNDSFKFHFNGTLGPIRGENFLDLFKHIHSCQLKILNMCKCRITFNQFLTLVKSKTIETLTLYGVFIDDGNNAAAIGKFLEYCPNLKEFKYKFPYATNAGDRETALNLLKLPVFKNLRKFKLKGCSPGFDLETFGKFMEKHSWVKFTISLHLYQAPKEIADKREVDKAAILSSWPEGSPKPNIDLCFYQFVYA